MNNIKEYIEPFLEYCKWQKGLADNSIRNYTFDMRFFLEFLEKECPDTIYCNQVTKATLEKYLSNMTKKYKIKTIKRKMAAVRAFYTYLEYEEIIEDNPFRKFKIKLREGYRSPRTMTLMEMDHFLNTVYNDETAKSTALVIEKIRSGEIKYLNTISEEFIWQRDVTILELLFSVGLRVAELCSLRFEDYDEIEHSFYIIGKGNRERTLYLENPQVINTFDDYLLLRRSVGIDLPYLFVTKFRQKMSTQGVRNIVTKYAKLSGLNKNITPHVFRHSFASLLLESGVDIKYIQEFLGHSSITTTQIYLHTSDKQKKKILATKHPRGQIQPR